MTYRPVAGCGIRSRGNDVIQTISHPATVVRQGHSIMHLLRETNYFFIGGIIATAILIALVLELLFRYG